MTKKISLILAVLALMAAAVSLPARPKGPCADDVQKFCKDIKAGHGRIWQCLNSHESELSDQCKARRSEMKEKRKEFVNACKSDAQTYCKDVKPGQGRKIKCLKENMDKLSPACKAEFDKTPAGEQ